MKLIPLGRGELDMVIAEPGGGDEVFTREDQEPLLIVDRQLVEKLNGAMFDLAGELRPGVEPEFTVAPAGGSL